MEKKLLKKDKLSGIVKKMAADKPVYAPVKDEDNVLLKVLEPGMEPLVSFANTKNAPKKIFFPHSELLLKYTRSPKGMVFSAMPADATEVVLFGVRPCDARSFALLDMLFDQEKTKRNVPEEGKQSGNCLHCHAAIMPLYAKLGREAAPRAGEADLIVAKHRNGPTATVTVTDSAGNSETFTTPPVDWPNSAS